MKFKLERTKRPQKAHSPVILSVAEESLIVPHTEAFAYAQRKRKRFPNPMGSSQSVRCHQTAKRIGVLPILFAGDPYGTRTHVTTVKGWCLNRLTNGPYSNYLDSIAFFFDLGKNIKNI